MDDVFGDKPVIYYNWDAGMDRQKDGILIHVDGEYELIKDVEFFDPIGGFIQTKTHFYMPQNLKGKLVAH